MSHTGHEKLIFMDTNLNAFSTKVGDESLRIPVNRTHPNVSISVIMKTRKPGDHAQHEFLKVISEF
jgi:hypothetical protein